MKSFSFLDQDLIAHPDRVLFWEQQHMLIVADAHFGKGGHFRRAGLAVPETITRRDLDRLENAVDLFNAEKLLFLGDLFHSELNGEWEVFEQWRNSLHQEIILVEGNHDILGDYAWERAGIQRIKVFNAEPFSFIHGDKDWESDFYQICGHIHPAIRLHGTARQSLRIPCFHFGKEKAFLPSFGSFTGFFNIRANPDDRIFVIADDQVIELSHQQSISNA